jgi:hypothetical protein
MAKAHQNETFHTGLNLINIWQIIIISLRKITVQECCRSQLIRTLIKKKFFLLMVFKAKSGEKNFLRLCKYTLKIKNV